jgi:hypothetical protein
MLLFFIFTTTIPIIEQLYYKYMEIVPDPEILDGEKRHNKDLSKAKVMMTRVYGHHLFIIFYLEKKTVLILLKLNVMMARGYGHQ